MLYAPSLSADWLDVGHVRISMTFRFVHLAQRRALAVSRTTHKYGLSLKYSARNTHSSSGPQQRNGGTFSFISSKPALAFFGAVVGTIVGRYIFEKPANENPNEDRAAKPSIETLINRAIEDLRQLFPRDGKVETNPDILEAHGSSANSYHPAQPHSVVVHVESTEDVVKVVKVANQHHVPIVAYAGATSLEGHFSGVSLTTQLYLFIRLTNLVEQSRRHLR